MFSIGLTHHASTLDATADAASWIFPQAARTCDGGHLAPI